jgi:hypothetical protein
VTYTLDTNVFIGALRQPAEMDRLKAAIYGRFVRASADFR